MQTENRCLKRQWSRRERGVAIFLVIFALMLLSAIAIALIYSTNTETGVNWNYRQEEMAYFAARAGMEEARDRMGIGAQVPPGPGGIAAAPCPLPQCLLPTATPSQPGGFVLYLINQGADPTVVQPWDAGNKYMDDELCHDGYNMAGWPGAGNVPAPGVRCRTVPAGNWWQTVPSNMQWSGTAAALPYKWVRVAMKQNSSVAYGDPVAGGQQNYYSVDPVQAATPQGAAQPVCYDGVTERVPPGPAVTSCAAWANQLVPVYANPVYLVTAMGVTGSGARKVVQAEVGLVPSPPFPYGLFSTSQNCNSLVWTGNAITDSYNSANGTYAQTVQTTGGDIGSFGNLNIGGNANIQGIVGVTGTTYTPTVGTCTAGAPVNPGITSNGPNWRDQGMQALPANITPASFPPPPAPNPPPPTTSTTYSSSTALPPGNYGNISITNGTLTLTPGVYNINSLSASGRANIVVSPLGQVVINIAGNVAAGTPVVSLTGQSVLNPSGVAGDFTINYAGSGIVQIAGQGNTYFVVDAPNAAVAVSGNGQYFGALIGNTINYAGNGAWHFDRNVAFRPQANQNYTMLSFREVAY